MPNPNTNSTGKASLPREKRGPNHSGNKSAGEGFISCSRCHNVLYNKKWQKLDGEVLLKISPEGKIAKEVICPVCKMITEGDYEGEVIVKSIPEDQQMNVLDLIMAFGKRAEEHDCEDRIIEVKKDGNTIRVTTTDNQLAVRLAKKIHESHKKSDIEIKYSEEPQKTSHAVVTFK